MSKENKDRLALRMNPETKRRIEQWYKAASCLSKNQFVEQAVELDMVMGILAGNYEFTGICAAAERTACAT